MAKKVIDINISVEELFFDAKNKVDISSRSLYTGENDARIAHMKIDGDENNELDLLRSISSAFSSLKTHLSEFLQEEGTSANNVLPQKTDVWSLSLLMPSNYNSTTREAVAASIHNYMVSYSLSIWFQKVNADLSNGYVSTSKLALEELMSAIYKRLRPKRKGVTIPTDGRSS